MNNSACATPIGRDSQQVEHPIRLAVQVKLDGLFKEHMDELNRFFDKYKGLAMFVKIKTYRDEEPYLILNETSKMFDDARGKLDFKNIGEKNNIINTVWALIMLSFRLQWLCKSILSCQDYYSAAIIYRAFIEHSFKHRYIFIYCIKKGDDIAEDYVSSDHIADEQLRKLRNAMWPDGLTNKLKVLKNRTRKTADKFTFKEVSTNTSRFLREFYDNDEIQTMFRSTMVQYSALSSYVHAGPMAVLDLEKKPKNNIDMSSVLFTIIAYNDTTRLLSSYPSEHQDKLKTLNKEIDKKIKKALAIYEKNYVS